MAYFILLGVTLISSLFLLGLLVRNNKMNKILKERNEIIIQQNRRLEEENKIRTQILSILSHDLRTPLTTVHLLIQILRTNEFTKEEINSHFVSIERSINSSIQLSENILFWAKNQIKSMNYHPVPIDLKDITNNVLNIFDSDAVLKNIKIVDHVHSSVVFADKEMVCAIIRNLISNAIKYTHECGKIDLSVSKKNEEIIYSVKDNGIGMSDELKSKIFTTEIESVKNRTQDTGIGIGLVLCYDFAQKCKGNISFESELGVGSNFHLSLPFYKQQEYIN